MVFEVDVSAVARASSQHTKFSASEREGQRASGRSPQRGERLGSELAARR